MSLNWWESGMNKPSQRLGVEVLWMNALFSLEQNTLHNKENRLSWDTPFRVKTLKRVLHLKNVNSPYWEIDYQMLPVPNVKPVLSSNEVFRLQILYPAIYPAAVPQAEYSLPDTSDSPHRFPGTRKLCLYHSNSAREGWDPARSTAATIAAWSIQWARAWLSWKKTGSWPDASK